MFRSSSFVLQQKRRRKKDRLSRKPVQPYGNIWRISTHSATKPGRRPSNVSWLAPNVSPATGSPLRISFDSSPSSQLSRARNYYGGVAHLYLDPSAFMSNGLTAQARACVLLK